MKHVQAVIIGGGSAGLAAAVTLKQQGIEDVLVLEKDDQAGGILQQCIHNGFGLQTFHEQLSGPAYAERFLKQARDLRVEIRTNAMVTALSPQRQLTYVSGEEGYVDLQADVIILAVGCYERSRGAIRIPGQRPAGIYTAGQAQHYLNLDGYQVGQRVFILGSGDIGLIMARRMKLEGAEVLGVAELMPYSNGLPRNIHQCLEDYGIPLYLSHTVTNLYGRERLQRLELSQVDAHLQPIPGSQQYFDVDTLLLSVGLIPENHLAEHAGVVMHPRTRGPVVDDNYMTSVPGIFACGNGLHVHDLVDYVSLEASLAAQGAARMLQQGLPSGRSVAVQAGSQVSYTVPSSVHPEQAHDTLFFFRICQPLEKATVRVRCGRQVLYERKKEKLMPSVMEQVLLKKEQLAGLAEELTIEVEEEAS